MLWFGFGIKIEQSSLHANYIFDNIYCPQKRFSTIF